MSIFISVASFCDPVLTHTLQSAVRNARWPDALHFAVVDQNLPGAAPLVEADVAPAKLTAVRIDALQARGPCWARALAMTLYSDEDWYFQIDSHMDFDTDWDSTLIAQAKAIAMHQPRSVISSYPNAFHFDAHGQVVRTPTTTQVLAHLLKKDSELAPDHPVLTFDAHPVAAHEPIRGFHLGAGCLFAPGVFAERFPYDPHLYFHGEEQSMAARLFTHGWDIFHMPGLPLYHQYITHSEVAPTRALHWDAALDAQRTTHWHTLLKRSQNRMVDLLWLGRDLGVYGLGRERTLAEYADFCGLDYPNRRIGQTARVGPWHAPNGGCPTP